jgi:hypothetical protein
MPPLTDGASADAVFQKHTRSPALFMLSFPSVQSHGCQTDAFLGEKSGKTGIDGKIPWRLPSQSRRNPAILFFVNHGDDRIACSSVETVVAEACTQETLS